MSQTREVILAQPSVRLSVFVTARKRVRNGMINITLDYQIKALVEVD